MRKILTFLLLGFFFVACDLAKESVELKPDVEVTWINPVAYSTSMYDTTHYAIIEEIYFVAKNSVDSHLEKMVWAYYDITGHLYYGPFETPIYLKIPGLIGDECAGEAAELLNVPLPIDTVRTYGYTQGIYEAQAILRFIAADDYNMGREDTAEVWFGFFITPP